MSETSIVQLQKKRGELENELSSTAQKEATLEKELRTLEEEVAAQLEGIIHAKYESVEKLESAKSDLARRLKELKEQSKTSQMPEEPPLLTGVEPEEHSAEPPVTIDLNGQSQQTDEMKEEKSCSYCGAENKTDAIFCEKCGNRIE